MTENEAKEYIESLQISKDCELVKTLDFQGTVIRALETLQQYREIGTVEEVQILKDKNKPNKPIHYDKHYYKCSACGEDLAVDDDSIYIYEETPPQFCPYCGQKLDWGR